MPTLTANNDGYVTDEPNLYSGLAIGAGVLPGGGPFVGENNYAWLKFTPSFSQGATIDSAVLSLRAHDFGGQAPDPFNTTPILIRAFAADEPTVPTSYADFLSRTRTTAQVVTSLPVTAHGQVATVSVAAILQELALRAGFTGQAFILTIEPHGTSDGIAAFQSIETGTPASIALTASYPTSVGYFEALEAFSPGLVATQEFVSGITAAQEFAAGLEAFQAQEI
jgi:hypothetical protein